MLRILVTIDPIYLNRQSLEFACFLAKLTGSRLTGLFLAELETSTFQAEKENEKYNQNIEAESRQFRNICANAGVNCAIEFENGRSEKTLVEESMYADILLIDADTSTGKFNGLPSQLVKETLAHANCPVIIGPESFDGVDEIIFAWDGNASSVFAIKQFTYLFPELKSVKISVLHVTTKNEYEQANQSKLKEWLMCHYNTHQFVNLGGDDEEELFKYLLLRKNVIVIMGAYGRSGLSQFFHHSRADLLIKTIAQPLFIAHQ